MSNESRFVAESLGELLTSIADGVKDAQEALSNVPPLDDLGRPVTTYHLPYLDFELQVEMETVTTQNGGSYLVINHLSKHSQATKNVTSTISGRLIAVPPNEGVPLPVLKMNSKQASSARDRRLRSGNHQITVFASNSAGEILSNQSIELNIDIEASRQLSSLPEGTSSLDIMGSKLQQAVLITDDAGMASTTVELDPQLPLETVLVITAILGSASFSLSIPAEGNL